MTTFPARVYYPRGVVLLTVLLDDLEDGRSSSQATYTIENPRNFEWLNNTSREADTFTLELDYKDFPFDPRAVRSILVALHMDEVGSPTTQIVPTRDNLRLLGFVDEPESRLGGVGMETVSVSGRDYTSLFLDTPFSRVSSEFNIDRPLRDCIQEIVKAVPGAYPGVRIAVREENVGSPAATVGKSIWAPRSENDDCWTAITDLCALLGLLATVRKDTIYIEGAARFADVDFRLGANEAFVYGEDLVSLNFRRKFNETRTEQVEVRCWDPTSRTVRSAKFPPQPVVLRRRLSAEGTIVSSDVAPLNTYLLSGVYSQRLLGEIAEDIYTGGSREQVEGDFETHEARESVFALRNGSKVSMRLGKTSEVTAIHGMSREQAVRMLTSGSYPMSLESAVAAVDAWRRAGKLASVFYVKKARHSFDHRTGYSCHVSFINYVGGGLN